MPLHGRRDLRVRSSSMPAKSKKQQMAAGAALAAKRGEMPNGQLRGASKSMAGSMNETQLEELAHTKRKSLPKRAGGKKSSGKSKSSSKKSSGKKSSGKKTTRK
jgi:hypothetical protein